MTSTVDLVIPVKPLVKAKSRLRGAADGGIGEPRAHARLAMALARDTINAARAAHAVRRLLVVSSDPVVAAELGVFGIEVVPDGPVTGLNPAYDRGAAVLREHDPAAAVAALQADLPALRPAELDDAVGAALALFAAGARRACVADAEGTGSTLVTAAPGVPWQSSFGEGSFERHLALGCTALEIPDASTLRRDVDTADQLDAARALGLGPRTAAVLGA